MEQEKSELTQKVEPHYANIKESNWRIDDNNTKITKFKEDIEKLKKAIADCESDIKINEMVITTEKQKIENIMKGKKE